MTQQSSQQVLQLSVYSSNPIVSLPITLNQAKRIIEEVCFLPSLASLPENLLSLCKNTQKDLGRLEQSVNGTVDVNLHQWQQQSRPLYRNEYGQSQGENIVTASLNIAGNKYVSASILGEYSNASASLKGSYVSIGEGWWQVDMGYKPYWWSPFSDTAIVLSNNAESMPSIGFRTIDLLSQWQVSLEVFVARQSKSMRIYRNNDYHTGHPLINGFHLSMSPVQGLTLSLNRIMQYGGGPNNPALIDIINGFFDPSSNDNSSQLNQGQVELGNQAASLAVKYHFNLGFPLSVYAEYGGEDAAASTSFRFGNASLGMGFYAVSFLPEYMPNLNFRFETRNWQNGWYVHHIYKDGLTNHGLGIGAWTAMEILSRTDRAIGGESIYADLHWQYFARNTIGLSVRTIKPEYDYGNLAGEKFTETAIYSELTHNDFTVKTKLYLGQDLSGHSLNRIAINLGTVF